MKHFLNHPLRIILGTNVLALIAPAMLAPFYAVYVRKIGGDILDAGLASSLFALVAGITVIVAGKFSDKLDRRLVVSIGYLVTGLGFIGYIFVNSIAALMFVQVVIGLAQASTLPAFDAIYSNHIGDSRHVSSRWGMWEASNYFSIAVGAALGGFIVEFFGFNLLFLMMAAFSIFAGFYLLLTPKEVLQ